VLLMAASMPARADVSVAIVPGSMAVDPGALFDVRIEVTEVGSPFNAFDLIVGFDAAALTAVPISPLSAQLGAVLTAACPAFFHDFHAGGSGDAIGCSMLCAGVSVAGPGEIYRLRFRASETPQATTLTFVAPASFYDAGIRVSPVATASSAITIGTPPLAAGDPASPARGSVRAAPNPVRSGTVFHVRSPGALHGSLAILDLQGRTRRCFPVAFGTGGTRQLRWDGRAESGAPLPPGVYQIVLRSENRTIVAGTRVIVLR
jgi:hypothetical protein